MQNGMSQGGQQIVTRFGDWVKTLSQRAMEIHGQEDVRLLEQQVRDQGRSIFQDLMR